MGLFCLVNCLALATGPHVILSKSLGLHESSTFWKAFQVFVAYIVTQLTKMIFIATFFPASSAAPSFVSFPLLVEVCRNTVDFLDLAGIYLVLDYLSGKGQYKVFIVGLSWAIADLVFTKYVPIWVGTRGLDFDWSNLLLGFEANLDLVLHLVAALLVWLCQRKGISPTASKLIAALILVIVYRPLILQSVKASELVRPAAQFACHVALTIGCGLTALYLQNNWRQRAADPPHHHHHNHHNIMGFAQNHHHQHSQNGISSNSSK